MSETPQDNGEDIDVLPTALDGNVRIHSAVLMGDHGVTHLDLDSGTTGVPFTVDPGGGIVFGGPVTLHNGDTLELDHATGLAHVHRADPDDA